MTPVARKVARKERMGTGDPQKLCGKRVHWTGSPIVTRYDTIREEKAAQKRCDGNPKFKRKKVAGRESKRAR